MRGPLPRFDLGGCPIDVATREELVARLADAIGRGGPHHHVSLNAAKWVAMRHDETLRRAVREASTVAADGTSIVRAAGLPERIPGIALAEALLERAPVEGWRVALVGARAEVVAAAGKRWRGRGVRVVLARDGYFAPHEERAVAEEVASRRPDLLLLALGTPKAEHFAWRWGPTLGVPLVMGVGGSFDIWAGVTRRAPALVGAAGLEWAWRFAESPRARFRRAIVDSLAFAAATARGERLPSP